MKKSLPLIIFLFCASLAFSQITLTENHTAPTCYGLSNGSATITASGGTAPYSYTLVTTQNITGIFTGLPSGTQTVVVEDANSLTSSISITIPVPPQIIPTATYTPVLCNGTATGTINITSVIGGNPLYQYNLNGAGYTTSPTFINVFAGIHTVGVKDIIGCTGTQTVLVTEPTQLNISVSSQNANCTSANGVASTTVTGGTPTYTYTWSNGSSSAALNNVAAGTYTVTSTDANGCSISSPIVIGLTNGGTAVITASNNVTCNGMCDGSLTAGVMGGTGPFSYLWTPNGQNGSTATGLCAGTYSCTITDFYGCTSTLIGTITQPSALNAIVNANYVRCFGTNTGTVSVAGSGGNAPYSYLWTSLSSSLATVSNVSAGIYPIIVTDANGCFISQSVTVTQPSQITSVNTVTASPCNGTCSGAFNILPSGGNAPYSYTISNGSTSNYNQNQCAGNYTATIIDANNCAFSSAITVPISSSMIATTSSTNSNCGQANGGICVTVSGGQAPYNIQWNNGLSSMCNPGLFAGAYTFTVIDINGCAIVGSGLVNDIPGPVISISSQTNVMNCGACTGVATSSVIGGSAPYIYSWSNGQVSQSATNLCSGTYTVTVTDNSGCIGTAAAMITQPNPITVAITATNSNCGQSNGSICASFSGGTPPYNNLWSNGVSALCNSNIVAGSYSYTVTDVNGCVAVANGIVNNIGGPIVSITSQTNSTGCGACNGAMSSTVSGGVSPYTYTWSNGQITSSATNLCSGIYYVTVTDNVGCIATSSAGISQSNVTPPSLTITATPANCGQSNGAICANISGGTGTTTIVWSTGSTMLCNNNIPSGAYSCTVTDINGCSTSTSNIVGSIGGPIVSITSQTNITCFNGTNGAASSFVSNGTAPYTYSWSASSSTLTSASNLSAGIHTLLVTDAIGCIGTQTFTLTQPPQLLLYLYNTPVCLGLCNGSINSQVYGGTTPYAYTWSTGATTANYLTGLCIGTYSAQVTDMMGCVATHTTSLNYGPIMNIAISHTNVSCGGACDGSAITSISGGSTPVTYLWQPGLQTGYYVNNLCTGTNTLTITDINGCPTSNTINILNTGVNTMTNAIVSTNVFNETCLNSGDGNIDLTITGSNLGPFTYHWNNGATSQDIYNLNSNQYSVVVYDAAMNCLTIQDTVFTDGVNCGTINGNIFLDNNVDCIKNSGDNNFFWGLVLVNPGNRYGYTNGLGDYSINNLPFGTYTVSLQNGWGIYFPTPSCNSIITTTINSGTLVSNNNNFSIGYNSATQPDMATWAYSNPVVPGFNAQSTNLLLNLNNVQASGLFKVTLPNTFITNITTVTPSGYTLSGDTIIWNFNNMTYNSGATYFTIDFYVPTNTPLGSVFSSCSFAQPNVTDFDYTNNDYCYSRTVTGSFDPNDKTVSPLGIGVNGDIAATETDLTYLIRFQNTGNGPAVNIVVKDTLSPNVDVNTFEMLGSSHNYNIEILPGNILKWKFNNIMLPDSNSNEPGSHGYIQYRIKRNSNNTPGTQIKNTAYIYFDFNEPVVTNTAINTIEIVTGISSQSNSNDGWNVYPNPSTGVLYIVNSSSVKEANQLQILNAIGQTVLEETITSNYKNIDLSKLTNGVYFVKITSDKSYTVKRVVLSK